MSDSNNPDVAGNRVVSMRINLTTGTNADQPIYTNYSALELAAGTLFMDFGFLEPRVISAVAAAARQGAKLPEQLNGKLVARLVLSLEAAQNLQQQLQQILAAAAALPRPPGAAGDKPSQH